MELSNYCKSERGRQRALAIDIGAQMSDMSDWVNDKRPVPVERCVQIERATNGVVTRRDLRPRDWWLIWPELITDEFPAPQQEAA